MGKYLVKVGERHTTVGRVPKRLPRGKSKVDYDKRLETWKRRGYQEVDASSPMAAVRKVTTIKRIIVKR